MEPYETHESTVRSYSRSYPVEFTRGVGAQLFDVSGKPYLDFLSGCGALNYGHNDKSLVDSAIQYISGDGVEIGLDMYTSAKCRFIETFRDVVLKPRGMDYRLQFTGPTGANAVEAAIKLARKVTRRMGVLSFTNAFHGCSLGALALTGSSHHRAAVEPLLQNVIRHPFDGYYGPTVNTAEMLSKLLSDPSSGLSAPAAIILETVQGEGGLNVASATWLCQIAQVARKHKCVLIIDDIQAGCGRTGTFFSYEGMEIEPDIVVLSKSLSGFGLPLAMLLIKPHLDAWNPGEHNGTFRGTCLSFVTGATALEKYWSAPEFAKALATHSKYLQGRLLGIAGKFGISVKGRGFLTGLDIESGEIAEEIKQTCFEHGLLIEVCGPHDEVLKLLPPLNVTRSDLERGLTILERAMERHCALNRRNSANLAAAIS